MIKVNNLRKEFFVPETLPGPFGALRSLLRRKGKTVVAVDGISFDISPGEFVGYIGPNGAGKSTTIKMLTGILHPTSGDVAINGLSPQESRKRVVRNIGVVFGQRSQLWWDLPLYESFELLGAMYGVPDKRLAYLLEKYDRMLDLKSFWNTPVRKLSLGQRMRGEICASLLHEPDILFLDEPTIGLDVVAKETIREFLREINNRGVTVLLTTHDLRDIEKLCHRVIVINSGRILFDGTIERLHRDIGVLSQLVVDFENHISLEGFNLPARLKTAEIKAPGKDLKRVRIDFDRSVITASDLIQELGKLGAIKDIHIEEPDIEEAVAKLF